MDIDKYDEYYSRKPEREVITVETKIKSTNVGFSMLAKMGWVEGSPLGLSGDGMFIVHSRCEVFPYAQQRPCRPGAILCQERPYWSGKGQPRCPHE